jgi:hypothetical protein
MLLHYFITIPNYPRQDPHALPRVEFDRFILWIVDCRLFHDCYISYEHILQYLDNVLLFAERVLIVLSNSLIFCLLFMIQIIK